MMITWNSFLGRRNITLSDIVNAYGLSYDQLCAYFAQRGSSFPPRSHPEVEEIYGPAEPEPVVTVQKQKEAKPQPEPKKVRLIEASIKNTKKELLAISKKLNVEDANDRMTKAKILGLLEKTGKVKVLDVKTTKKKK